MKNKTEQLKQYWKVNELSFIATFKKMTDTFGFFNYLTNPQSKRVIYYPTLENVEIIDKRVSMFCKDTKGLVDGYYYKISLEYSEDATKKNNPYSLVIQNITNLDQQKIKEYLKLSFTNQDEPLYGCYSKKNDSFSLFENVMYPESGKIFTKDNESQSVYVSPNITLEEGTYYSFSIKENEGKLPNAVLSSIKKLDFNPYKNFVRLRFERLDNPEANKMIARLMREIGKGMYSSKQRMIFELLQNADDSPGKDKVEFHIDINEDYFFIMHDGAPFNQDDVEAITSAAESTKRENNKKTGYKGIGFKSVFTDSTEVWIKSGGYQFAFQRNNRLFDDFDKFYFRSKRYKENPQYLEEDKLKFKKQRREFNGSTDIPWQVIPIWQNRLPKEFNDSNFSNFQNPVQFALKLGKNNIEEYKLAIDNIVKRPQFLLFLRNTSKFRSQKNGVTVSRNDNKNIEIIKTKRDEPTQVNYYIKQIYDDIAVTDEAFAELNIALRKQSKINDFDEVTYYFTGLDDQEIETIPPKLAAATSTEISFGISLVDGKIAPEKEYSENVIKYSSLFTYLPMEDTRFQLPFLVNADFVPSSDRQKIQGDNLWNKYIIIKIAENHINLLAHYAQKIIDGDDTYSTYLSLLLKDKLPDDDTAQLLIDCFNQKYLEELKNKAIVVNDIKQLQALSETIVDNSGFARLFGNTIFYDIVNTSKKLPNVSIESKYLYDYSYLNTEIINIEYLASRITPEICKRIGHEIETRNLHNSIELLLWLDSLARFNPTAFGNIPFIKHHNKLLSIQSLLLEADAWVINKNTDKYEYLLQKIGFHTINLNLDKYQNIKAYLLNVNGYTNDKMLAYERIVSVSSLSNLDVSVKLELIDFFQNSDFMYGIGINKYFNELKLFVDTNGIPRPLSQLIDRDNDITVESIQQFKISNNEYLALNESLKKILISRDKIFTSFILTPSLFNEWSKQFASHNINRYINDVEVIYGWKKSEEEVMQSQLGSIPWIFINDTQRFIYSDKVFWSNAFNSISIENYEIIKSLFHNSKTKLLADKACCNIISLLNLKADQSTFSDWAVLNALDTFTINSLLDWLELDGGYQNFFENFNITKVDSSNWKIYNQITNVFDSSSSSLGEYIKSIPTLSQCFVELDKDLCTNNRYKIGALTGDKLLKAIIESKGYDQKLASYLSSDIIWEQFDLFIRNLNTFNLQTNTNYESSSAEHFILSQILRRIDDINTIPVNVSATIETLRQKVRINGNLLSDYDLSDIIQFGKGDEKKALKLSDVLAEFKGESDVLDNMIESFVSIKEKLKLRKAIFRTRRMDYVEILSKIESESTPYYTIHQVVFRLLYSIYFSKVQWNKEKFNFYWRNQNNISEYQLSCKTFLDIIVDLDFTDIGEFDFIDFKWNNCVEEAWAYQSEVLPKWVTEWLQVADRAKKESFISKLGYNGENSPIVKLRKSIISENYDRSTTIRYFEESKSNSQIIWNTIVWLSKYSVDKITKNAELIKLINNYVGSVSTYYLPLIESISDQGDRNYKLAPINAGSKAYKLLDNQEYSKEIYTKLKESDSTTIFVDSVSGNLLNYFTVDVIHLENKIDIELLNNESKLWDELYYQKWEHYSQYPIYIYNGNEIPYMRCFSNLVINKYTSDLRAEINGKYFVSNMLRYDVLNNLPTSFPSSILSKLKDWHYRVLNDESLLENDSFEYNEIIDRLLQNRLGYSKEEQRKENINAKVHAIYYLHELGYNISNINDGGTQLTNIISPDGNNIKCIVRSAKGGLLYLDHGHWDMLDNCNTYLIAIYPGNSPRLFKDRMELLSEELAKNVLFRIPNNRQTSNIDNIFDALKTESHLILVTSQKMKENLFSKLKKNSNFNSENDTAVADDNFSFS